jgi:hypothetical protein
MLIQTESHDSNDLLAKVQELQRTSSIMGPTYTVAYKTRYHMFKTRPYQLILCSDCFRPTKALQPGEIVHVQLDGDLDLQIKYLIRFLSVFVLQIFVFFVNKITKSSF